RARNVLRRRRLRGRPAWDAERGSKISVGTATGGAFAQRKIHFLGEQLGAREKSGAHSTFERGPVEAAGHFKPGAGLNRAQAVQADFEAAHVGNAKRAEIEDRASAFRDYIGARAAFKDAGVDRDATARIVPLLDARELPRQFEKWNDPCRGVTINAGILE